MIHMPGRSHKGPLAPLRPDEALLSDRLAQHVGVLAGDIGQRNIWHAVALEAARQYIETTLQTQGYTVNRQPFIVQGQTVYNLEAISQGTTRAQDIVLVGAHYDSVLGSPGANDNATGVAAMLEIARLLVGQRLPATVRLVAFVNEEAPFFHTAAMGSWVYARQARARNNNIIAMFSLETIGYYSEAPNSQLYPRPFGLFYPRVGNFIGFVGNVASRSLVRRSIAAFRRSTAFPSEGVAAPGWMTGIGWSDHWAFWEEGYPGVMITDTALFRYPHYHTKDDTPERIDYPRMARVVAGLGRMVMALAGGESP
jgi:hypothetical protein